MINKEVKQEVFVNYGDVNPLTHGGIWIKKDNETCFYIIKFTPETMQILDLYVDVSDSWLDKKEIMSYIGMTEGSFDSLHYAIGCTDYENYLNFGSMEEFETIEEVKEELKKFGINL